MQPTPTTAEVNVQADESTGLSNAMRILLAVVLGVCFFLVEHRFSAVQVFTAADDYSSTVNGTADRVEAGSARAAATRLLLATIGVVCLVSPARRAMSVSGALGAAIALFTLYLTASVLWSTDPHVTLHKLLVLNLFGLAALGLAKQIELEDLVAVVVLAALGYILIGVAVELQLGAFHPWRSEYRFIGTCHPNTLSVYGSMLCLGAGAVAGRKENLSIRWDWVLVAIGLATLMLTRSRTALAALLVAYAVAKLTRASTGGKATLVAAATLLLGAAIGYFAVTGSGGVRILEDTASMGRTEHFGSLTGRLPLWEELIGQIQKRPVLGYGYLAFWDKANVERLSDLFQWEIPHGHNLYLDVLLDGGFVGLGLFLLVLAVALRTVSNHVREGGLTGPFFALGMLAYVLVHSMAESLFKLPTFLSFGVLLCVLRVAWVGADAKTTSPAAELPASDPPRPQVTFERKAGRPKGLLT